MSVLTYKVLHAWMQVAHIMVPLLKFWFHEEVCQKLLGVACGKFVLESGVNRRTGTEGA